MVKVHITNTSARHSWCNRANYRGAMQRLRAGLTLSGVAAPSGNNSSLRFPFRCQVPPKGSRFLPGLLISDESLSSNLDYKLHVPLGNLKIVEA